MKSMDSLLEIGVIVKPQGIKGEVKIMPYADSPDALRSVETVFIDGTEHAVESFRHDGKMVYFKLSGVDTIDEAERLRNKTMLADMRSGYELPEGRHYIVDIIGCDVVDNDGVRIGEVTDVFQGAAQDVYRVKTHKASFLMPVVDVVVKQIDTGAKRIVIDSARLKEVALYED